MEKKPKQIDFASYEAVVKFDVSSNKITVVREHCDENGDIISVTSQVYDLTSMPFSTAMSIVSETIKHVALVNYE